MLLYRVARNLKHNPDNSRPSSPATIQILLNNCLKLLNKTKYPQVILFINHCGFINFCKILLFYLQIVTSVNYMLSDLYIPVNTNPTSPKLEDLTNVDEDSLTSHVNSDSSSDSDNKKPTYSVDVHDLCLSHKKKKKTKSIIFFHFIL